MKGDLLCPHASFPVWLDHWQALIAGIVGAIAILITVWWTLSTEKRRRADETRNMRAALGAELRQFMTQTLSVLGEALDAVNRMGPGANAVSFSYAQIRNFGRFPDAVVYRGSIGTLGSLGDRAFQVVHFFGQIQVVRDAMIAIREMEGMGQSPRLHQIENTARALLAAAQAGLDALPAFGTANYADYDRRLSELVTDRAEAMKVLFPNTEPSVAPAQK